MELYPGRRLFGDYADEDLAEMVALLEQAVADMHERKRRLKAAGQRVFVPSTVDPLEVIVVDELAFLTAYAPKDVKAKVAAALQVLPSQGRAVGYSVVAALQDPPATLPGVGFVHVEGAHEPVRVRFSYLTDDDITDMGERWPGAGGADRVIDLTDSTISPASPSGRAEERQS